MRLLLGLKIGLAAIALSGLAGCGSTALSPGKSVLDVQAARDNSALSVANQSPAFPAHPSGFEWASQTLRATGDGSAAPGMPASQREVAAQNSAAIHAKANLKDQVRALPVGSDQTVGSIMNTYITLRLAIEKEISSAQVISAQPQQNGSAEVQVELPMQNIATILQRHQITTDQALPATNERPAGMPNVI